MKASVRRLTYLLPASMLCSSSVLFCSSRRCTVCLVNIISWRRLCSAATNSLSGRPPHPFVGTLNGCLQRGHSWREPGIVLQQSASRQRRQNVCEQGRDLAPDNSPLHCQHFVTSSITEKITNDNKPALTRVQKPTPGKTQRQADAGN